jgi:hypothetical protein
LEKIVIVPENKLVFVEEVNKFGESRPSYLI